MQGFNILRSALLGDANVPVIVSHPLANIQRMITIQVEESDGERRAIEIPTDIQLTLMEVLKAAEYPVQATCGGMALCATCHVEVVEGEDRYKEATDPELEMLDTLPEVTDASRLACQMPIQEEMDGLVVRILADEEGGYG